MGDGQKEDPYLLDELAIQEPPKSLWSALAKIYLDQQQYDQAISVAGKSTSLARGNLYVEVENWKTIARALQGKGDSLGAVQAEARVDEIERSLGGG